MKKHIMIYIIYFIEVVSCSQEMKIQCKCAVVDVVVTDGT